MRAKKWGKYLLACVALCGMLQTGQVAKADTIIDAKPATTTEDPGKVKSTTEERTEQTTEKKTEQSGGEQATTENQEAIEEGWNKQKTSYYRDGERVKGVNEIDGELYFFNATGILYRKKGMRTLNGKTYYFTKSHTMKTGVVKVNGTAYYFQTDTGERYEEEGLRKLDKQYYLFDSEAALQSGWYRDENQKRYYFDKRTYAALKGWNYVGKYKYYFNKKGQLQQDVRKQLKKQSSYLIRVNRTASCVTVYAKDGVKGYTIPVVAFVCSAGKDTPTGTFYTGIKHRWHELFGPCWGQWTTQITGNILFHSVYYDSYNDNKSLNVSAYNKLGTMASHGCVRLRAGDAKWIYDNCKDQTKVIIYNNKKNPGPFDKPVIEKLSKKHTWDPTDPAFR
ncbi:MAG: L,D-transpeptidase family protein [Lachnospiraceae bacterium]|nr:L,D-transpeptidase family protein [Lachnospiraceae bacterium]